MEEGVLLEKKKKREELYGVIVMVMVFLVLCPIASSLNDEVVVFVAQKLGTTCLRTETFGVIGFLFQNFFTVLAGNLTRVLIILIWRDVEGNKLTGQIPDEIGNCGSLVHLDLSDNLLFGDIPFTISKLKQLEFLNLKNHQLTGPIPPTLTQIPNLKTLGLRGNMLTGTLSPDMCQLTGLWDISYNQITGEIPYNIGFLQVATLSLHGNKLAGKIPEVIGLMQALAVLDLSENELVGPIPPILGNLTYTGKLYLHGNKFTGPIPPELGNMSKLSYLQLNHNQLVGKIPAELGKLEQLFEFNVHGNRLSGSIPLGFRNLENLTYLNLSLNDFKGWIPIELGHIINLDTLDLSGNKFSGPVPASIGELEHLLTLNLSSNQLDGPLPAEFGNLKSIQIIDISFNSLSGNIPAGLGQMQNIVSLILTNNKLQGEIPEQLTNCFSLANLNVSYNNLSGIIPPVRNFTRFLSDCFIGNPLLRGNWLGSRCGPSLPKSREFFSRAAVVCMTLGFITLVAMIIVAIYKSNQQKQMMKGPMKTVEGMCFFKIDYIILFFLQISSFFFSGPPKLVVLDMDMAIHTFDDIMRFTENLSDKYIVGYGASSTVYKCSIRHRNIVSLHGYSLSPYGNLLFYEYMENGSLWDLLHVAAAQGFAYLHHDCNPRIIHRDVKSSNILPDENFEAHLSDFGIAKCIPTTKTHASTCVLGTIGYIDLDYACTSRLNEK
ncbi:hypothetical protein CRYUN_Cryun07bG0092600 [Craigia yunnanensis]